MAKDSETGNDPSARDAQPDAKVEDLEARRRGRAVDGNGGGAELEPEEQEELFPLGVLEGDPKRTLKNLIRAGANVSVTCSLTRAEIPNPSGGLFDPEEEITVLVRVVPGSVTSVPQPKEDSSGKRTVKDWKLRQELRAVFVQGADQMFTEPQVVEMLESVGAKPAAIASLLGHEPAAAANGG